MEIYWLVVLEARNPRSGYQHGWFLLEPLRENMFHAFPLVSGGLLTIFGGSLACRCITLISVFINTCLSLSVHVWLCVPISPFYRDTSHIGLGPVLMASS